MKKLALHLFKFLITVVFVQLIVTMLSYTVIKVPYYFDNYSKEFVNFKDIDLSFFGDSHSEYAFNDTLISKLKNNNTRNISLSGNALYNNILIVERALEINPKMVVNLSIGNHNVGESYFITGYNVDQEIKKWFAYYNFRETIYLFQKYPINFSKGFFGVISSIGIKTFGFSEGISRIDALRENTPNITRITYDYQNSNPLWLDKLTRVIKKYPKTKFRIIRVPIHNNVFYEDPLYLSIIKEITKLGNVEFQDYQNLKLTDNDFRDFTHLSKSGAEKLSREYVKRNLNH